MEELDTRQMNLRFELAASITSFKERLLNLAQYNMEEMDPAARTHLLDLIHNEDLQVKTDALLSVTKPSLGGD